MKVSAKFEHFDKVCAKKPLFGAFLAYFHGFLQKWDFLSKIGFSQFLAHIVTYNFQEKNHKINKIKIVKN